MNMMNNKDAQEYVAHESKINRALSNPFWKKLTEDEQIAFRLLGHVQNIEEVWDFISTLPPDRFTEIHDECVDDNPNLMQFLDMVRKMRSS